MKKVVDYLKNAPKGTKLYSPIFGECILEEVTENDNICVAFDSDAQAVFNQYGQYYGNIGECLLFPSKEVRDWSNYQLPVPHYDFKPFDKVVVKDEELIWHIDFFECYDPNDKDFPYQCMVSGWKHCLPFNEETAKLIDTKDDYAG